MRKKGFFLFLLLIATQFAIAQDSIQTRIVLIGDGGQFTEGKHPVSEAVKKAIPLNSKTVVIFLGDNVYKVGLPDDQVITYSLAHSVLDSQISIVENTKARLYMIPGNHDWNNGSPNGIETILREQYYVNILGKSNVKFYPEDGCPGPVEVQISDDIVLIIIDSQWWLHPYDKPGIESDCPYKTKDEVLTQLGDILARNPRKLIILATHHTFRSNGIHGGDFGIKQHIFPFTDLNKKLYIPLPVLGSIYPITRSVFGTPQDLKNPLYENMIHDIEKVAKTHPNLIFVAGHEHNLQLLKDTGYYYIVSGSGSKTSRVNKNKKSHFVSADNGFATLEISKNKNVRVSFYTVTDSLRKPYSENIMNFSKLPEEKTTKPIEKENAKFKDTVNVPSNTGYAHASAIQRWVMGNNYRREWSTFVNLRVFHINEEKGGFKITGRGGGKQTKSLKLEDKRGGEWTLRTMDIDPTAPIPDAYRNSIGDNMAHDLVSATHPYGALTIPGLAASLGIVVAKPEYFFVPDDPALGAYRSLFANTVCMLESRNPTPDGSDSKSTGKLLQKMVEDNDQKADQRAVLKARLLDMLVADWDRHFDQWKWGTTDTGRGKIFYPIPRDRDQALSYSDGFLIKYASRNTLPFLKGFRYNIPRITWLNWTARDFDRAFLNQLSASEWKEIIDKFQATVTDSVINKAVRQLPPEIYAIDGKTITAKLKSRRGLMEKEGMKYYHFLSHYVNVVGSNKPEYFRISSENDGRLTVSVYERSIKTDTAYRLYKRTFDHKDTKELRLYGLNGNDLFRTEENVSSRIKIRIIGGKGNDTFDIRGRVPTILYDMDTSANYVMHKSHTRLFFSSLPSVNEFNWSENQYGITRYPRLLAAYDNDDGFIAGAGFRRRTFGFRKTPFSTETRFDFLYAFKKAFQLKYTGEFNQLFRNTDLLVQGRVIDPALNNFFGFGNNTVIDKSKNISYYLTRYKYAEAFALFRKKFFNKLSILAGPLFNQYWIKPEDNTGKILQYPSLASLDSAAVYEKKSYFGGKLAIQLNNLNSDLFPSRGIEWNTELSYLAGLTGHSHTLTKLTSDMVVYASQNSPARLITVIRLGAGHIFSKDFEYFQALNLGANNFLRGFRKNRFSGSSLAYGSLEFRLKLFTSRLFILPGDFGLLAFDDAGRVWMRNQSSRTWHNSAGTGIYFVPFNMVIVSAYMAFSKEENMLNISAGARMNITF